MSKSEGVDGEAMRRRDELLSYLDVHGMIAVNRKWQSQTKRDSDIKWLIKKGKVKLVRYPTTGRKQSGNRQTYLVLSSYVNRRNE